MEKDMKRLLFLIVFLMLPVWLFSCKSQKDAAEMAREFLDTYGAEGVIYTSRGGEDFELLTDELFKKIYIYDGDVPKNCALFLNSFADYGSEFGIFVCEDAEELRAVEKCCLERIDLLGRGGDNAILIRCGGTVFYSTMSDGDRAREIWKSVAK